MTREKIIKSCQGLIPDEDLRTLVVKTQNSHRLFQVVAAMEEIGMSDEDIIFVIGRLNAHTLLGRIKNAARG